MAALTYICFFFNDTATTEIYTLSLHDALPILALRAVIGDVHVVHHGHAVIAGGRVAQRAIGAVGGRHRNVIGRIVGRADERHRRLVAVRALSRHRVWNVAAVRLGERTQDGRRRPRPQRYGALVAGRAGDRGDRTVHHRGRGRGIGRGNA